MQLDMLYKIGPNRHTKSDLKEILSSYNEIKFVSLMGIDLYGNGTEERIPVKNFLKNIDDFLEGTAIQTDGSSVNLPGIATINDAKIDMVVDKDCDWFINYNRYLLDENTNKPVGTLIIPSFLFYKGKAVDSRSVLKNAMKTFKEEIFKLIKDNNIADFNDVDEIELDTATELEFWVKTPNDKAEIEALTTSENLKEQYWGKMNGDVRTSLEEVLIFMDKYDFNPEMGHKEVGGVRAKVDSNGKYNHVMEQLEVDWRFSNPIQTSDNQIFIKDLIQEIFLDNGLETTFMSKPIEGAAGNGMHIHFGVKAKLKDGRRVNLFNGSENHFLGSIGYGALMGILKNYEVINPFIASTHDSLRRLKPGYEAPVCIVSSLGNDVNIPSRNRTVLVSLIKDNENKIATRFELRSPSPKTNIYLATAASYMAMLDGIKYSIDKDEDCLLRELSKKYGEEFSYLEKYREYRCEEDIFEDFSEDRRDFLFGRAPKSVFQNISNLDSEEKKLEVLKFNNVFDDKIINSFKLSVINRWKEELRNRIITEYTDEIKGYKTIHSTLDNDIEGWDKINKIKKGIAKDSIHNECLFTRIKRAINNEDYKAVSDLSIELEEKIELLRKLYYNYKRNVLDF